MASPSHRCKKLFLRFFIIFIKKRVFNVFLFLECFLFSSGQNSNSTKPAKFLYKTIFLSDEFNMADIRNSPIKSHISQLCHAHYKTLRLSVILLENFFLWF